MILIYRVFNPFFVDRLHHQANTDVILSRKQLVLLYSVLKFEV